MGSCYQRAGPFISVLHATAYFKYGFNRADTGMAGERTPNSICSVSSGDRFICNGVN